MKNTFGDNIRLARTKQKLTQEKLAELSGLSLNFVSNLERNNSNNISIKNATKIADALGMPLTALLTKPDKAQNEYPSSQRLNYLLMNLPKNLAEEYATEFINILRIQNKWQK